MTTTKTRMDAMLDQVAWEPVPAGCVQPDDLPYATHRGVLLVGAFPMVCYQLSDGQRVIDQASVEAFFGMNEAEETG